MTVSNSISKKIIDFLASESVDFTVKRVVIGEKYAAVLLPRGGIGVAAGFDKSDFAKDRDFPETESFFDKKALDLIAKFDSPDKINRAIALAAANALINPRQTGLETGDVITQIEFKPADKVGMIGCFQPLIPKIKPLVSKLNIFELVKCDFEGVLPYEAAGEILPECDVAIVTATTIVNKTFDEIMGYIPRAREVVVLGASTPLSSIVFADTPVTLLSGIAVSDEEALLRIIASGGGMKEFKHIVAKVNLRLR